jgi:hypothetical protein
VTWFDVWDYLKILLLVLIGPPLLLIMVAFVAHVWGRSYTYGARLGARDAERRLHPKHHLTTKEPDDE